MLWAFTKMQGCGNDYIYFDCFDREFPQPEEKAVMLSRAHFGVGGDGIILIEPSDTADARMRIFNQDGSEGLMCGNGIRCVGKYLYDSGRAKKDVLRVETKSGIKVLQLSITDGKAESVRVDMGPASFRAKDIPVRRWRYCWNVAEKANLSPVFLWEIRTASCSAAMCSIWISKRKVRLLSAIPPFRSAPTRSLSRFWTGGMCVCASGKEAAAKRWPVEPAPAPVWRQRCDAAIVTMGKRLRFICWAVI